MTFQDLHDFLCLISIYPHREPSLNPPATSSHWPLPVSGTHQAFIFLWFYLLFYLKFFSARSSYHQLIFFLSFQLHEGIIDHWITLILQESAQPLRGPADCSTCRRHSLLSHPFPLQHSSQPTITLLVFAFICLLSVSLTTL